MWTKQHKQRWTGKLIVPAISLGVMCYFGFHAYQGEYGIYATYRYEAKEADLQARLDAVRNDRQAAERRVQLIHDGTLDRDMLDEQARRALNVSHADEITIMRTRFSAH